ncbi:NAD(P)H-binding protein [Vagococcus zengguangii]|uniref:NAD(P)-dependent oxidoreductase n=1 Tax=Vagococcus zengguangii TaxID=2571750 RepID=A0A4D7CY38_9ENTE|nr:NAD(P)H-binding protein [Vagococcus zengguangii]QCI86820.1 NAD(P)-dependent oxidoreductase [Vagococcus zengguangii]TLG80426.1 NAD(P)-dependent oxidoreductase [Vagococcus zengguangii]
MKIAVIAANGKIGQLITNEAVDNHFDVTAIVRNENHTHAPNVLKKDLFDLTAEDLQPFDVVIDAAGFWAPEDLIKHETSLVHLTTILKDTAVRLIIVGGAGSLYLDETRQQRLMDLSVFPESYKPLAQSMANGLDFLRTVHDVEWLYVSPADDFQAFGVKTGNFELAGDILTTNEKGQSFISYPDYALGIIELIKSPPSTQQRVSLYTK